MAKIYQERQDQVEHQLLTKVIPMLEDGAYPYHTGAWLSFHEMLRREFLRLQRVMKTLDPITYPWKALCLKVWLSEFFVPTCLLHEEHKYHIWYPVYESKGVVVPGHLKRDPTLLTANISELITLSRELFDLINTENIFRLKIIEKVKNLSLAVNKFINQQLTIFHEEELFWPQIFLDLKLKTWNEVLLKQMKNDVARFDAVGTTLIAAVMHGFGYNLKVLQVEDELDIPWAGPWARMDMTRTVPFSVRALPAVIWMKRYLHYKNMINSLRGDEDTMELQASDFSRSGVRSSCRCTIS